MAAQCEQKTFSPLHPIFEQALKSFMPWTHQPNITTFTSSKANLA
jgi:hypothetical protein